MSTMKERPITTQPCGKPGLRNACIGVLFALALSISGQVWAAAYFVVVGRSFIVDMYFS